MQLSPAEEPSPLSFFAPPPPSRMRSARRADGGEGMEACVAQKKKVGMALLQAKASHLSGVKGKEAKRAGVVGLGVFVYSDAVQWHKRVMTNDYSKQLIDLEIKVAHHENTIDELNDALYKQQIRIDQLEKTLNDLRNKIQTEIGGDQEIRPNEKPPHY